MIRTKHVKQDGYD